MPSFQACRTSAVLLLVLVLVLVLTTATCTNAASAPAHRQLQRQRQRAFVKYAERVGAALDLFANGPGEGAEVDGEEDGVWSDNAAAVDAAAAATAVDVDSTLAFVARAIQLPHTAVQAAVQVATHKVAAARTLASVLSGASLTEEQEEQLASVRAAAASAGVVDGVQSVRAAPTAVRKAPPTPAAHVPTPPTAANAVEAFAREVAALADAPTSSSDSQYITCRRGYIALASSTQVSCENGLTTSLGRLMAIPAASRQGCSITPQTYWSIEQQQCICPVDMLLIQVADRAFVCVTRPVDVQVMLEDLYLCYSAADASLGLPGTVEGEYCVKTTRAANLSLAVQWKYTYISLDALRAAVRTSASFVTPAETPYGVARLQWVVLGATPPYGIITPANSNPYAQGNYSQLTVNTALFSFLSPISAEAEADAAAQGREAFYISSNSSLYSATAFSAVFSFGAPRRTLDHLKETSLNSTAAMTAYLGNVNGTSAHTLRLDLSNVSDSFVEGNQMYVETGIRGGSTAYTYRVARLHISFTDLAAPSAKSHKYPKQFNPLYILLIVAIGAVVLGGALAVLWYRLMEREEYDDSLVADAQRKREKKAQEK